MSASDGAAGVVTHEVSEAAARDLLVDLVETPSVTGDERECAERLAAFFERHDRETRLDEVGNVRAPGDDGVLLTSHIDTVPGEIPVEVEETDEGEVLWGRGSVDAKGPLAAMAVAAVETGASFVGVVGEETDSRGARHLVDERAEPAAVVNGEPSGWDDLTLGYRGFLAGTYSVAVDSVHSSRPDPNAVEHATSWLSRVKAEFATDDPVFESVTVKPVEFDGGLDDDGLATAATVDVQFRIPPGTTAAEIRETAESELDAGSVSWDEPIPPTLSSPRTDLARAFRVAVRAEGGDPGLLRKTGTSDANLYAAAWDCPVATYGPGDSTFDHAPDERLDLAEFDRAVAVLGRVAENRLESHE
ncbi:[LysW]-lysine hydrolase [Halomicrococcus sp. NG-SE-24]|uniref:[LysW]-lysine hydrolase n=1 Tax=Halomicrococcus sp. NG-SE-24 TaxID=3436928 RepID=UPI003D978D84